MESHNRSILEGMRLIEDDKHGEENVNGDDDEAYNVEEEKKHGRRKRKQ